MTNTLELNCDKDVKFDDTGTPFFPSETAETIEGEFDGW